MEFKNSVQISFVLFSSFCAYFVLGNKLITQGSYTEYMSRVPTLTCKFESTDDPMIWYLIRWSKLDENNKTIPYAVMPSSGVYAWTKTVPAHFQDHVKLQRDMKDLSVSLNMEIDGFICSDAGRFQCQMLAASGEYTGYTELNIEAHPGTPMITENFIEVSENDSFSIECRANVGRPPQELSWAYKMPGQETYTTVTTNISHEHHPTDDCTFKEISRVTLVMTAELDGTVFLCISRGELGEGGTPMNYDEVIITLHRPPTTTTPGLSSTVIIIEDTTTAAAIAPSSTTQVFFSAILLSILSVAHLTS